MLFATIKLLLDVLICGCRKLSMAELCAVACLARMCPPRRIAGSSKMLKVSRSMKNVKHLDAVFNRAVKNQIIFKVLDTK